MNLDHPRDRLDIVKDLKDYSGSITNKMADDSDTDANDWCRMWRLQEKLTSLGKFMIVENWFSCTLDDMNDMKQSDEDSKWTFPLEKELNHFVKNVLLKDIDSLIDCSRSWSFEDYRARNFQNELYQKMTMLKDWYTEAYDSEDDDE